MTNDTKLAIITQKLRLPSAEQLCPWLARLVQDPDSVIIIAIEKPLRLEGPRVATAWLSPKERLHVRNALERVNVSRLKKGEHQTKELPQTCGFESD
jgi:hypothetical protein